MEHDRPSPARRRLLTGAAALAAAAALPPFTAATARAAAPPPPRPPDDTTPDPDPQGGGADYPPCHWVPADPANFTAANRPTQYQVDLVVMHVTQETYDDTIRLFQDPNHKAAAHYVVRSADGYIARCVSERNVAWHAGSWDHNTRSIGIEHEGWIDDPKWFTDVLYEQSALLTAAICDRYGIPKDREHIIGHVEVPGTDHTDPGEHWDWARYMDLVEAASRRTAK
ncbi:N-acetylmuramoyl-L-alanine amidase [Streptomyces halobius]|uniref:N-acetylmuramoyl-L-alanine amidase n=1 Tax=Streptomyces halobius TaxID=2879846 RepID=A0ABY4M1Q1_9ACTN|nr:N-acetylmuramoyl-L-alanine amidase [Streptomyces halobius]UQA91685.1 N-acetylmuramoyl-L-alanine amidase [Streptomyces halobius]